MSYIPFGALADFVTVGPHYYTVDRPNAVQVIQRGPHGMRFAADPVRTREGKIRGSGFRFWNEQQVMRPDEKWYPREKVVGLMGLGQEIAKREATTDQKRTLTQQARSLVERAQSTTPTAALFGTEAEVRGAMAILGTFFPWSEQSLGEKYSGSAVFGPAGIAYKAYSGSDYDSSAAVRSNLQIAQQVINRRLGRDVAVKNIDTRPVTDINVWEEAARQYPGQVRRQAEILVTGRDPEDPHAERECPIWDVSCLAKKHWWKVVLVAGGVLFFYGAGQGVGRGIVSKFTGGK